MLWAMDSSSILDQVETVNDLREIKVESPPIVKQAIQKINYSHDGMINLLIANRGITQNEIARHFGYSASWVSQIMSSDAFQARLMERAAEIEDPTLRATVEEGLKGILARSMELLKKKLNDDSAPDNLVLRSLELSSRALGYGAREQTVAVQVNVENHLEHLGGRLTELLRSKKSEIIQPALEAQP
jgi:transcriptional regulator with XRE-family HTH domain